MSKFIFILGLLTMSTSAYAVNTKGFQNLTNIFSYNNLPGERISVFNSSFTVDNWRCSYYGNLSKHEFEAAFATNQWDNDAILKGQTGAITLYKQELKSHTPCIEREEEDSVYNPCLAWGEPFKYSKKLFYIKLKDAPFARLNIECSTFWSHLSD